MNRILLITTLIFLFSCNSSEKKAESSPVEERAEGIVSYSEVFDASFENVLNRYYALRDALVASDAAAADNAANGLIQSVGELKWDELKSFDTSNIIIPTAQTYTGGIDSESKGLVGETDIENKRKSFQMISGNLFDLARTVRYGRHKLYLLHCPMAFDNAGADWLSSTTDIKNPYFGDKMLTCGAVKDSVVLR